MRKIDKKIYVKKVDKINETDIWIVDGKKIRSELDIEFVNFGHHFIFPYIPRSEFWLDKEAAPNERCFYVNRMLTECDLISKGISYPEARKFTDKKEKAERKKRSVKTLEKILNKKDLQEKSHCQLLKKLENGINIWLVHGKIVRDVFDIDFTEGGHDLVYNYVPKNEVWIDNDLLASERPFVILHELFERSLMSELSYDKAHEKASRLEWKARQDKIFLKEQLDKLGWR